VTETMLDTRRHSLFREHFRHGFWMGFRR